MHVQRRVRRQGAEVSLGVGQNVASRLQLGLSEDDLRRVRYRVAPPEVVVPRPRADIAEHRSAVAASDFARAVDVVEQLVVVEGVIRRHVAMPGAQVRPVVVEVLVVLPDADNGRHQFDLSRHARFVDTGLLEPLRGRQKARIVLVEPVAVEDGEIDLALLVCPHQRA